MNLSATERIDFANIFWLFLSCAIAIFIPFELFLFVYAVLGPLHYLTEISWLHDRGYFTTGKRDMVLLVVISFLITIIDYKNYLGLEYLDTFPYYISRLLFIGLTASVFFAFIKSPLIKWIGIFGCLLVSSLADNMHLVLSLFLPTLIHVYVFTFLFMLYGSIKSKSKVGYAGATLHLLLPLTLFYILRHLPARDISSYGRQAYESLGGLNVQFIQLLSNNKEPRNMEYMVFRAPLGIFVMRFVAFAYTYHYLNWFSKTGIIGWHKVSKLRLLVVLLLWAVSVVLYIVNYQLGLNWLFLLSFMHVMLELPLNMISIKGVLTGLRWRT